MFRCRSVRREASITLEALEGRLMLQGGPAAAYVGTLAGTITMTDTEPGGTTTTVTTVTNAIYGAAAADAIYLVCPLNSAFQILNQTVVGTVASGSFNIQLLPHYPLYGTDVDDTGYYYAQGHASSPASSGGTISGTLTGTATGTDELDPSSLSQTVNYTFTLQQVPQELAVYVQPPQKVGPGQPFDVEVYSYADADSDFYIAEMNQALGAAYYPYLGSVTIALTNPGNSTLGGTSTVTAVNGVADFPDLTINDEGIGYTLQASSNGLAPVTTDPFDVQDFTLVEATEAGPGDLLLTYNVLADDLSTPITLQVFRSASPGSYDPSAPLATVSITNPGALQQGQQQVELSLNGAVLNINPSQEYVNVVADPTDGQSTDPDHQVYFQKLVLGVVTHGFAPKGVAPPWTSAVANALQTQGYNYAIAFDWADTSNLPVPGEAVAAGNELATEIIDVADTLVDVPSVAPGSVVDLNLIGHSRGAVVVTQALQDLASTEDPALEGSYKQLTLLDPHPANIGDQAFSIAPNNPLAWLATAAYEDFVALAQDPAIVIPGNANEVDIYYQQTSQGAFPLLSFENTLNLQGDLGEIDNSSGVAINYYSLTNLTVNGSPVGHSEVPVWYLQYAVPDLGNPPTGPAPAPQVASNPLGPPPTAAAVQAFLYPQFVGDPTVAQSLASEFAAACMDLYTGDPTDAIGNFQAFSASVSAASGTTISQTDAVALTTLVGDVASETGLQASPVVSAPAAVSLPVGGTFVFDGANAISLTDPVGTTEQLALTVGEGTLDLENTVGLTVTGNGTDSLLLSGTLVSLNSDLPGLSYTPSPGYSGSDTLSISNEDTSDNLAGTESVAITVNSLAPVITAPASVSVNDNATLAFTASNSISVSDSVGFSEQLILSVDHGTLSLGTTAGLTVSGNGTGWILVNGVLANLDSDLASLSYTPASNYSGADTLWLSDEDLSYGITGAAGISITAIGMPNPNVVTTDAGGTYDGNEFPATASATGTDGAPVSGSFAFTYYAGNTVSGQGSSTAPSIAGTYTVVAAFTSSDPNYGNTDSEPLSFTIGQATPVLTLGDAGGTFNGSPFPAAATIEGVASGVDNTPSNSLEGVGLTLTYYAGSTASGAPLSDAPSAAGTYTVVASFAGSQDYASESETDTFTIGQATPNVTASDAGGTYNGDPFQAAGTVAGVNGTPGSTLEGVGLTFTYYAGSTVSETPLSGAPSIAGTYTAQTTFAGSQDYSGTSNSTTFTIGQAMPTVTVSDAGGTFNGSPFTATDSVTGVSGTPGSTLEGVGLTLAYYAGTTTNGTPLSAAPSNAGTYTVEASFAGSRDYNGASNSITFTIGQVTPSVTVTDAGGTYNGNPHPASATATGVGEATVSGNFAFAYYVGSTVTGTPTSTAPTNAGTYTVVTAFTSTNSNYVTGPTESGPVTFTIGQATLTVVTTDTGGPANGNSYPASATATGVGGATVSGAFAFTYYVGSTATGTGSATAPSAAGTYTVVAAFTSTNSNYVTGPTDSAPVTFTITATSTGPAISAPSTATVNEDAFLVFSSANPNAITLTDAQAGGGTEQLTLTATHGTLIFATSKGITLGSSASSGSSASPSITIRGTLANLNGALNGLKFTPTTGYSGSASLSISYKDLGNNKTASATVAITVVVPSSQPTVTLKTLFPVAVPGEPVPLVVEVSDTNAAAQAAAFTFSVSFGDTHSATFSSKSPVLISHVYTKTGTFTVSVTATDEFGHTSATATTAVKVVSVAVETDPFNSSETALFVGTSGTETIDFTASGKSGIAVTLGGVNEGVFTSSGPLLVFGQGGKDMVKEGAGIKSSLYLLPSSTADNVESDMDEESIRWAGLTAAVEILNA